MLYFLQHIIPTYPTNLLSSQHLTTPMLLYLQHYLIFRPPYPLISMRTLFLIIIALLTPYPPSFYDISLPFPARALTHLSHFRPPRGSTTCHHLAIQFAHPKQPQPIHPPILHEFANHLRPPTQSHRAIHPQTHSPTAP